MPPRPGLRAMRRQETRKPQRIERNELIPHISSPFRFCRCARDRRTLVNSLPVSFRPRTPKGECPQAPVFADAGDVSTYLDRQYRSPHQINTIPLRPPHSNSDRGWVLTDQLQRKEERSRQVGGRTSSRRSTGVHSVRLRGNQRWPGLTHARSHGKRGTGKRSCSPSTEDVRVRCTDR